MVTDLRDSAEDRAYTTHELEKILANRWPETFSEKGKLGAANQFAKNLVAFFGSHPRKRENPMSHEYLIKRLREKAELLRAWHSFELVGPAPSQLSYLQTAEELIAAAEALEHPRSPQENASD